MNLLEYIIEKFDGEILQDNRWRVDGSKGDHYYVEWHPYHGHYSCGCKGYMFRKKCRHIQEIKNSSSKSHLHWPSIYKRGSARRDGLREAVHP